MGGGSEKVGSPGAVGQSGIAVNSAGAVALSRLVLAINAEHDKTRDAAESAVRHAIKAGEYLNEAKTLVPVGSWSAWLAEHFNGSPTLANCYMRLALNQDAIEDAPSMSAALEQIATGRAVYSPELAAKVRAAVRQGKSQRAVAERFGLSQPAVSKWLDPKRDQKRKRHARQSREARRLLQRAETERLGRRVKSPAAKAYSDLRRTLQALDQALEEAPNQEAASAIRAAMRSLYNAEDSIGAALRSWDAQQAVRPLEAVA